MSNQNLQTPRLYPGVMVSSTFRDLKEHRAVLMDALRKQELVAIAMEDHVPRPDDDVISSSLKMVEQASAYIGLISHRYGEIRTCATRNPKNQSATELEFDKAQDLKLPTLIFVMGEDHPVKRGEVETDEEKSKKLKAFRKRAKGGRIYIVFESLEDFTQKAIHAVAMLRNYIDATIRASSPGLDSTASSPSVASSLELARIPQAPAFYAEPPYIGSHSFIGRGRELETLDDWATAASPHAVMLFEAIGGTGKSMLTWHWATQHSTRVRSDWAGRFWYSFYERGAIMEDFCRHALAYITGQPLKNFKKQKTAEFAGPLLEHLRARPWLMVLDGLERVLVSYHRFDAAQASDEDAGKSDQIAHRDPCAAIRPEDDELLRGLAAAAPSRILLTTRLTPRSLLNVANQPIPGVRREVLPGMRPADAESLLRACGVSGNSQAIQAYLQKHCDCHPLVTGVIGGLVIHYLPDRGNFDAWAADLQAGGHLNLAELNLVQKRTHILKSAIAALPEKSRQLLSTLALLSEAADYAMLSAFNPHLPAKPQLVEVPENPADDEFWIQLPAEWKKRRQERYQDALLRRAAYEREFAAYQQSLKVRSTPQKLADTVKDLERRGLLQYDAQAKHYDLHPVVRAVTAGSLGKAETDAYGQSMVDYFSQQPHSPFEDADTLDDVRIGLQHVRTLLLMGRHQAAANLYRSELGGTLYERLEAHAEVLSLLKPLFPNGWTVLPGEVDYSDGAYLANCAGNALSAIGEGMSAISVYQTAMMASIRLEDWDNAVVNLSSFATEHPKNSVEERYLRLAIMLAEVAGETRTQMFSRLYLLGLLARSGRWSEASAEWRTIELSMPENFEGRAYAQSVYVGYLLRQGHLGEDDLFAAEQQAKKERNRMTMRYLQAMRGEWRLEQAQWALAATSLQDAARMAREVHLVDSATETMLALARFHLGQLQDPHKEAEYLVSLKTPAHLLLAQLWLAMGDREKARKHALIAYKEAWGEGEPYVNRYKLDKAATLLGLLGVESPKLPPYDPSKDETLPWEDDVMAAIEKLRAQALRRNSLKDA